MKKIGIFMLLVLASGCVSSSKHKKTVKDYEGKIKEQQEAQAKDQSQIKDLENKLVAVTQDKGQLKSSMDELKKALEEMKARREEEQKRLAEFKDLTTRFKALTDSGTLTVRISQGRMVVSLGSDVLFSSGSAKLSEKGIEAVKEIAKKLNEIPEKKYQVEGHTDNVPIATALFPSNWELASTRAINVAKAMVDAGLANQRVSAASFGDTLPVAPNETPEGKALNRRIEIVIVPDLSTLPGYEELNKLAN